MKTGEKDGSWKKEGKERVTVMFVTAGGFILFVTVTSLLNRVSIFRSKDRTG
jgi:hypothetical protein